MSVVLGYDESPGAARALDAAIEVASAFGDYAVVANVGADEINASARWRRDVAVIDYIASSGSGRHIDATGEEILLAHTQGAGDKSSGVNFSGCADQNACGINQPDFSV